MSRNVMVAKQVNKFIKYCQKNSIDKYAIDTYGQAVFYNFDTTIIRFFSSNNNPYCILIYDSNTYIFRYKDKAAFIALNELKSPADGSHKRTSDYSISREEIDACLFNYKDVETTATVNGKRLKFCLDTSQWDELYFYTFDDSTCLRLMSLSSNELLSLDKSIQNLIGKLPFCRFDIGDERIIPEEKIPKTLNKLVTTQKVMLSMLAK